MLAGVVLTLSMTNFPSFDEKEDVVTQYLTQVKFVLKHAFDEIKIQTKTKHSNNTYFLVTF